MRIDEEPTKVKIDKIASLRPAFKPADVGTVTAANSSSLNDGACALVVMSAQRAEDLGLAPLARIVAFADAEQAPPCPTHPFSRFPHASVQDRERGCVDQDSPTVSAYRRVFFGCGAGANRLHDRAVARDPQGAEVRRDGQVTRRPLGDQPGPYAALHMSSLYFPRAPVLSRPILHKPGPLSRCAGRAPPGVLPPPS